MEKSDIEKQSCSAQQQLVWDLPIRLSHWSIVILVFLQWLSAEVLEDAIQWHAYFGYTLLGIVLFRIVWGFIGTHYARFSEFVKSPAKVVEYLKVFTQRTSPVFTGHNPPGGWMSLLLLLLLLVQASSGLFITDDIFFNAPYYDAVSSQIQDLMSSIHHTGFTILKIAIGLHIAAVLFYVLKKKQSLIKAMITGKKATHDTVVVSRYWIKALITVLMIAVLVYCVVEVWAPEPVDDWY